MGGRARPVRLPWPIREARLSRLATRAARGERSAVVSLYRALHPGVSRFVGRRVHGQAAAEDAVSTTFHRLLESLARLDPARGSVEGYALSIARSVLREGRRESREAFRIEDAPEPADPRGDPLGTLLEAEGDARLRHHLAALPDATRELLALRFADGLRFREIATVLGEPEATLRQRASRAVRELRESLREDEGGELAHG